MSRALAIRPARLDRRHHTHLRQTERQPSCFTTTPTESVQHLANVVSAVMHAAPDHYFTLATVRYLPDGAVKDEILVRLLDYDDPVSTLAGGSEIVHCQARDGRLVDLLLGKPERELQPALVVITPPE